MSAKVGQAQTLRHSLLMQFVDGGESLGEWNTSVRGMQVENIYTICTQLLQTRLELSGDDLWFVLSR